MNIKAPRREQVVHLTRYTARLGLEPRTTELESVSLPISLPRYFVLYCELLIL